MGERRRRTNASLRGAAGVVAVLVLAGVLFSANARIAGGADARRPQDLHQLVQAELDQADELADQVELLRAEVDRLTDAQTPDAPADEEADQLAFAAGLVPVEGPGLAVSLTDAPLNGPRPEWATNNELVVHQQDLQAVINALWAGGAEAMTLQGQRVVSTSAFRCVGNVLLLHGRHYSPPYVVEAIGNPDQLREALLSAPGVLTYLQYVEAVGLGWSVSEEERLAMPAYEGNLELEHADVPDGAPALASGATP